MDKLGIMQQLRAAGVWKQADGYREEVRKRLRREGKNRAEAVEHAWAAMCDLFMPLARPRQETPALDVILGGEVDDILDSAYTETDGGRRIRDSLFWVGEEFRRVVQDTVDGTVVVDFRRAKLPPPTAFAVQVVETYAAKPRQKRAELIAKIMRFADRSADGSGDHGYTRPRSPEQRGKDAARRAQEEKWLTEMQAEVAEFQADRGDPG